MKWVRGTSPHWPKHVKGLKFISADSIPELYTDKVPFLRNGAGPSSNGEGRGMIEQTLELRWFFVVSVMRKNEMMG